MGAARQVQQLRTLRGHQRARDGAPRPVLRLAGGLQLQLGRDIKAAAARNVGVAVGVGIARTKTLAKLANKWAKHNPAFDGVCRWDSVPTAQREALMAGLSVVEPWGVATRLTKRLNAMGILSILDLSRADPVRMRDKFSVVMMRTILELQGTP